jgi:hypothetical protein
MQGSDWQALGIGIAQPSLKQASDAEDGKDHIIAQLPRPADVARHEGRPT